MIKSIERFLEWLKSVFLPASKHPHNPRILATLPERGRCTISVVHRDQARAIATYLATPLYRVNPPIQIWIYCDHLAPVAGDPVKSKVPGATHRLIVAYCKAGTEPRSATLVQEPWVGDYILTYPGRNLAVPVTEILARSLIASTHDVIDWYAVATSAIESLKRSPRRQTGSDRARIAGQISHHLKKPDPPK